MSEEQEPGGGQALDQAVEQRLGFSVVPVQVLEQHHERLDLALSEEKPLHSVQAGLPPLGRIEPLPFRLLRRDIQQREQGGQRGLEAPIEREDLAGDLLADLPAVVPPIDLEVGLEQINNG